VTRADDMARALTHHRAGRLDGAIAIYRRVLEAEPTEHNALALYATALIQRDRAGEALPLLRRSLALAPGAAAAHTNLGEANRAFGNLFHATDCYRRALSIDDGEIEANANLGLVLGSVGDVRAAPRPLRRAIALAPEHAHAMNTLGNVFIGLGQVAQARCLFQRSLTVQPAYVPAESNLASTDLLLGRPLAARARLLKLSDAGVRNAGLDSDLLFTYAYDPDTTNRQLYDAYRRWARRNGDELRSDIRLFVNARDPDRRLRVGYLSADLRRHPIAQIVEDILANHDHRQFEIVCFADVASPDDVTDRLRRRVQGWHTVAVRTDRDIGALIRESAIDILVIIAGHTSGNRIVVATAKPAPIVVNFHDISTSGLETVDYWLTDTHLHPAGHDEGHTETLWHLPSLYLHTPPLDAPAAEPSSDRGGILTFGSFNNPAKLNDTVLGLWARLLRSTPGSRLMLGYRNLLSDDAVGGRIRRHFAASGVATDRVSFAPDAPSRTEHLARLFEIDVALDPFPFNGGITTFEALWMGVPVVTLAGCRFAARGGVSHLEAGGLSDLVATTPEQYIDIARSLATDRPRLSLLRSTLRRRIAASPLCDGVRYTAALEGAYRQMWRKWCSAPAQGEVQDR
jgi:protein O-GlcNAc transferase